jgi:hypothetical protein
MFEPFFIVGFQRSGTTLLRLMLYNHPEVAIPLDPVGLWSRYAARLSEYGGLGTRTDQLALIRDLLDEERIRLWGTPARIEEVEAELSGDGFAPVIAAFYQSYTAARGKRYWGDKDPGNMTKIDTLNAWFPGCRIVHIIRDGRDACLSQLGQDFGFDELYPCAEAWCEEVGWVRQIGSILGSARYHELRYEDLIEAPERKLRLLCDFLELEFDPAMLAYYENVDQSIPGSKRHIWPMIDRPPVPDNVYRWKREFGRGLRTGFEKRAGSVLAELGYETDPGAASGAYLQELLYFARKAGRTVSRRLRDRFSRPG